MLDLSRVIEHLKTMPAVRSCGCDEILDRDPLKYDTNRHYYTCHHSSFTRQQREVMEKAPTPTVEELMDSPTTTVDLETLSFDDCETKALAGETEVIDSGYQSIDLNTIFNEWMTKVLDDEPVKTRTADLSKKIKESLSRQLQDGLLSYPEYIDLEYISRLWMMLLNMIHRYRLGCQSNKRDILSILLELFESKQIPKTLFIESVLQL